MELKIQRSEFLRSLQRCQGVVPSKGAMSILSYLLFKAVPGGIELAATDLEISIRCFSEAEIIQEGEITLLARKAFEIVRELPETEITVVTQPNNTINFNCGKSNFTIPTLPAEDFPTLPDCSEDDFIALDQALFSEGIRKTIFAIPTAEVRFSMNGVLMEGAQGALAMVSTDGHRLCCYRKTLENGGQSRDINVILPKKLLLELRRLLEGDGPSFSYLLQEKQIVFKIDDVILTGRLIEGNFPNYRQVLEQEAQELVKVKVDKDALFHALKRVSLLADEKNHGIKIQIKWGQLYLASQDSEWGNAQETIESDYKGEEINLAFNAGYLMEIINAVDESELILAINQVKGPCIISPADNEEYSCVVMPLRTE